jgi:predicted nuclease of predicted toxin-antitoxin system
MAWKLLPDDARGDREFAAHRRKAKFTRFLVDESLGPECAKVLGQWGYKAEYVSEVGLNGRSDEEIIGWAWRHGRVVLTHDHDFLDNHLLPEHRNPGVIILPGARGDDVLAEASSKMFEGPCSDAL